MKCKDFVQRMPWQDTFVAIAAFGKKVKRPKE